MWERQVRMVRIFTLVIGFPFSSTPLFTTSAARRGVIIWFALTITFPSLSQIVSQEKRPVIRSSRLSISSLPSINALTIIPGISRFVPAQQSDSRTIICWDTSTRRLVRYPESAVRSAVSDRPLRAPCADMKYSSTSRPSRKFDLIGSSMVLPVVSAINPRIPASCLICLSEPRAPESAIMKMLLYLSSPVRSAVVSSSSVSFQVSTTSL